MKNAVIASELSGVTLRDLESLPKREYEAYFNIAKGMKIKRYEENKKVNKTN